MQSADFSMVQASGTFRSGVGCLQGWRRERLSTHTESSGGPCVGVHVPSPNPLHSCFPTAVLASVAPLYTLQSRWALT